MNKLIQTTPPSGLERGLGRSFFWTLVCLGSCRYLWHYMVEKTQAFSPGLGGASMTHEGSVAREMTVLATMMVVMGYLIFTQTALPDFPAARIGEKQPADWPGRLALGWWALVRLLKWTWLIVDVFIVLGCLASLNDPGNSWN